MNTKIYTIAEVKKAATAHPYKLGVLFAPDGNKATKSNAVNVSPAKWIENDVQKFLTRQQCTPGVYYLHLYHETRKKTAPDIYPVAVGKLADNSNTQAQPIFIQQPNFKSEQQQADERVLTYAGALELRTENERLKMEVTQLTKERDQLQREIDEIDNDTELSEGEAAPHWLEKIITGVLPTIDAFMNDRQEQRKLEYVKLLSTNPEAAAKFTAQRTKAQPVAKNDQILQQTDLFLESLKDSEAEIYARIEAIMQTSANPNAFFLSLKENEPEVFARLQNFLNSTPND